MNKLTYAKADSVEFLDLCAPEFHETRKTTLIYALDLSVEPQRYFYLPEWFDETIEETIQHVTTRPEIGHYPRFNNEPMCSSRKLIEVARSNQLGYYSAFFFLFCDFVINGFESFPRNWESERIRLYFKYVNVYCHFVEESVIVPLPSSVNIILTFERPPIFLDTDKNSSFTHKIKKRMARKLILTLFENNSADSSLVAEIFGTMCIDKERVKLLFVFTAKATEYLLYHLKKEKYDLRHMFETVQETSRNCSLLRNNPEHLLVLLNNGLKIKSQPDIWYIEFHQLYPSHQYEAYWGAPAILTKEWDDLNARGEAILDIFAHFLNFSAPHFAIYLKSLRYIWRSIPDCFITYEEMKTLLLRNADITEVEDTCSNLQKWEFDSFDTILQPRSLTHYSRCVIRDSLERNSQLPEGIEFLGLPSRLNSYLRLEF